MTILAAWLKGVALGLGVAMPIGPINVEIIRRHLSQGFAAGLLLGLGACTVDTAYIVVISVGLIKARPGPRLEAALLAAATLILVLLAWLILRSAAAGARRAAAETTLRAGPAPAGATSLWHHYAVGLAMTAVNPINIAVWLGVVASGTGGGPGGAAGWGPQSVVVGVMCATVAWVVSLNLALIAGRRLLRRRLLLAVNVVSAMVLLVMAGWNVAAIVALTRQPGFL